MSHASIVRVGNAVLQFKYRRARFNGSEVKLTEKENKALETLVRHGGVVPRMTLCAALYSEIGFWPASLRHVDPHICRVRRKLEGSGIHIHAVYRKGYRLVVAD